MPQSLALWPRVAAERYPIRQHLGDDLIAGFVGSQKHILIATVAEPVLLLSGWNEIAPFAIGNSTRRMKANRAAVGLAAPPSGQNYRAFDRTPTAAFDYLAADRLSLDSVGARASATLNQQHE